MRTEVCILFMGLCCLKSKHDGLCWVAAPTAGANWRADLMCIVWGENPTHTDFFIPISIHHKHHLQTVLIMWPTLTGNF